MGCHVCRVDPYLMTREIEYPAFYTPVEHTDPIDC